MFRTLRNILTIALTALFVASAVVLAADTVSGTVENVDPQQGRMILRAEEGKVMELRAPTDLLTGLPERRRCGSETVRSESHIYSPAGRCTATRSGRCPAAATTQREAQRGAKVAVIPLPCGDYTLAKRPTSCKHACNSATSSWYA